MKRKTAAAVEQVMILPDDSKRSVFFASETALELAVKLWRNHGRKGPLGQAKSLGRKVVHHYGTADQAVETLVQYTIPLAQRLMISEESERSQLCHVGT